MEKGNNGSVFLQSRVCESGCDRHLATSRTSSPGASQHSLPPISVLIVAVALQPDDDEGHDGLDDAELQSGLLAEAKEADVVRVAGQAARAVHPA